MDWFSIVDFDRDDSHFEATRAYVELISHLLPDADWFTEAACFYCRQEAERSQSHNTEYILRTESSRHGACGSLPCDRECRAASAAP